MNIINWLNLNQGFVMSLLTLVYVIATIVIVYYNRKSIFEIESSREAESRPYIYAYIDKDPRELGFYFRVKNYGKTGAKIENIQVTPNLNFAYEKPSSAFLNNIILAPEQMLYFIIVDKKEEVLKNDYKVEITYSSLYNPRKKYTESYMLIIQYFHQMGYTDHEETGLTVEENALKNIAKQLDSIRQKIV